MIIPTGMFWQKFLVSISSANWNGGVLVYVMQAFSSIPGYFLDVSCLAVIRSVLSERFIGN